ncbi:MAG TPA: SDR family NAD-dependent epimerase/dehydratase [Nitrospirales bacterium]|nr:SDR family NAD-dependent epimerase/dehydratase [Nitrospirales bacterium]
MKVLITGGFGFIGGRLGQYLQQAGHHVILGTRRLCDPPHWLPTADVVQTAWNDVPSLIKVCARVDAIVHCAGMNAEDCVADRARALECNGLATAHLLNAAVSQGVERFMYLSTAHVYASPLVGTITEETWPRNLHVYATSHRAGEDVVLHARQRGEIEGIVIRVSNAFGVPVHKDVNCWALLVNDLCRQVVQTGKMVLRSTGVQQRDFITLDDVCRAITHLLELSGWQCQDGLFNLGSENVFSVFEMGQRIARRCPATLEFTPDIERPGPHADEQYESLRYDCSKLHKTGFHSRDNIEEELDHMLAFCGQTWGISSQ